MYNEHTLIVLLFCIYLKNIVRILDISWPFVFRGIPNILSGLGD